MSQTPRSERLAYDVLLTHYDAYSVAKIHAVNFATQMRQAGCLNVGELVSKLQADGILTAKHDSYALAIVYHFDPDAVGAAASRDQIKPRRRGNKIDGTRKIDQILSLVAASPYLTDAEAEQKCHAAKGTCAKHSDKVASGWLEIASGG